MENNVQMKISIVIPVYYNEENLQPLYSRDNLAKSSWYEGKLYRNGKPV